MNDRHPDFEDIRNSDDFHDWAKSQPQSIQDWVYKNADDREKKRAAMWSDPDWINYTKESAKLGALESQENKLLKPVDFYDLKI